MIFFLWAFILFCFFSNALCYSEHHCKYICAYVQIVLKITFLSVDMLSEKLYI